MTADRRDDEDTAWIDTQLTGRPSSQDPLVRRTVAAAMEAARDHRAPATLWGAFWIPAVAGVCMVALLVAGRRPTPQVAVNVPVMSLEGAGDDDGELSSDWLDNDLLGESVELAEWDASGALDSELGLEDLTDEELRSLSTELKEWPGSPS